MESFVQDALKMAEKEQQIKRAATGAAEDVEDFGTPKIVVVGCGGGGNNTVNRLYKLSCIGGGHGNPLQCSCLENPRDCGAWWAAVHGVTQTRTRLKRLRSSSSSSSSSSSTA